MTAWLDRENDHVKTTLKLALGALLALGPVSARAADDASADTAGALGLEQAQQEAVAHSPQALMSAAKADERRWGKVEAGSAFLPQVSLDASHFSQVQYQELAVSLGPISGNFPEVFPYSALGFDAHWTLFEGLAGLSRLRAACLQSQAAGLEQDWSLFSLRQDVRLKYYQALTAQKLASLADENVKTLEDHLRMVQDLLANGQATRFDVLRVEVQLSEAKTERLSSQDHVLLSRRKLTQAMGLDQDDDRPLAGDLPVPGSVSPAAGLALDDKPDLKAQALQAQAAEAAYRAAQGAWLPRISLVGGYQWYNNVEMQSVVGPTDVQTAYQVGFAADWDLFSGGATLAHERQAAARAEQARQGERKARQQAQWDRELWTRRLAYSTELYRAKQEDVDKSKESVRLATLGEKAGTRTSTEVLDAELDSFRAAAGAVSAQMDAAEALINLELALGQGDRS